MTTDILKGEGIECEWYVYIGEVNVKMRYEGRDKEHEAVQSR